MPNIRLGFIGRTSECRRLDGMLADARNGQSAVLVIRGDAGMGKTALLRYAARQAAGLRTAEVEGVHAEMELAFAGIHRLCAPMSEGIDVLAEPQQNALRVALGVASGDPPNRFLVAVAVLSLLSATAEERPLLCLVDDAQWLDAASVQALGFVARRLVAEPIAMIFAMREPIAALLDDLPQLTLEGLDEPDARALLSHAVPGRLDDRVRDRIIAETGSNPLALIELSQRMSRSERAGGFAPPVGDDLPSQLEERYLRRVGALPTATQRLMLLAAAEPRATLLRGHAALVSAYGDQGASLLLEASGRLEPFDLSLARRAYLTAFGAAITAGHLGGSDVLRDVCRAVLALPPLPPDPHPLDLLIEGYALRITDGYAVAVPVLQRAAKEVLQLPVEDVLRWGWLAPGAGSATWDDETITAYERQARIVRDAGALGELPINLQALALEQAWLGDLSGARQLVAESDSISAATGNEVPPFAMLRILALQGREAVAFPLIKAVIEHGTARGQGQVVTVAHWAAAVLYNGSDATRKRQRQPAKSSRTGTIPGRRYGLCSSWSRPPRALVTRTSLGMRWMSSRRRRALPVPASRSASRRVVGHSSAIGMMPRTPIARRSSS